MMPWIQVYSNLPGHKKLYALSKALGIKRKYETVGIIVSLWLWAAKNAPDGDITDFPVEALEDAVPGFRGLPKLYTALLDTGWLDQTEDGRIVFHDWEEYAGLLMDALDNQKKKTRERVRKYRAGKSGKRNGNNPSKEEADVCNVTGNVTETLSNAPTRPDQTRPYNNDVKRKARRRLLPGNRYRHAFGALRAGAGSVRRGYGGYGLHPCHGDGHGQWEDKLELYSSHTV